MKISLDELTAFFDDTLRLSDFRGDVSNNGLQIEGCREVSKIVFAVDACQKSVDFAAGNSAQMLFVHHGLSWGGNPRRWTGITGRRFGTFFRNGISLYAAHLPLDAHEIYGNNAVLCDIAGVVERKTFFNYDGVDIGFKGVLENPRTVEALAAELGRQLKTAPQLLGSSARIVRHVGVVSGGGGLESVADAVNDNCDLLITGELTHVMYHEAMEAGLSVIALGHYASETTGVSAMMQAAAAKFPGLEVQFADFPTGL